MGVRKYFSRVGKVDILVVHFRLLTIQMQIDVHITLYTCYTTKKMTHITATVPKMRFAGSNVSFHTVWNSLAAIFLFSFHIVCFFSHRDLLLSAVAASLHYLPQMSAFNSHMQQNAYCRNLLPSYCYAIKGNFKTVLPQASQPASAGNVADLVKYKSSLHDARTANPALVQCECHTSKWKLSLQELSCWL